MTDRPYHTTIYLEGPRANAQNIEAHARELENAGYRVASRWHRVYQTRAHRDFFDVALADVFILFLPASAMGWVKCGVAQASGCRIIAIGKLAGHPGVSEFILLNVATWDDLKLGGFTKLGDAKWKKDGRTHKGDENLKLGPGTRPLTKHRPDLRRARTVKAKVTS